MPLSTLVVRADSARLLFVPKWVGIELTPKYYLWATSFYGFSLANILVDYHRGGFFPCSVGFSIMILRQVHLSDTGLRSEI
jgi:hypothetical protein